MTKRYSIDKAMRYSIAFLALVIAVVAGLAASMSIAEERQFWKTEITSNYRHYIATLVRQEFTSLRDIVDDAAQTLASYERPQTEYEFEAKLTNQYLHNKNLSGALILDIDGNEVFSKTVIASRVFNLMKERFVSVSGIPFESREDFGMVFVEGRIFLYSTRVVQSLQSKQGNVTMFAEVTSEMLAKHSQAIGLNFDIQYTSASHRVVKVSYANGIDINIISTTESSSSLKVEYQVTFSGGILQPASFVLYVPMSKPMLDQWVLPVSILFFVLAAVLGIWIIIRQILIQPSLDFAQLITREPNQEEIERIEKKLPLELERVYSQFKELYEDIERQRRFSDLLVEAIGDAIITVNWDGEIDYINPAAVNWIGFSEVELVGSPLEMYISTRNDASSGVASWIYQTNMYKRRIETKAKLTVLGNVSQCFDTDVICQPIDLKQTVNSSTAVIVIRVNKVHECDYRTKGC
ncbi:PAS domain-containing protein [Vibrio sp. TBV020]|uniref:PAS domain-containing protein n=1 Tax=Vibrio sp. TBV020 TaxID=3137398 RepID=UPI0038CDA6A8